MTEAKIVTDKARIALVDLDWPVEYNGKMFTRVMLRRITVGELAEWQRQVSKRGEDEEIRLPLFRDENGEDIPEEVWNAMDQDDLDMLGEEAIPFLPRRFRGLTEK